MPKKYGFARSWIRFLLKKKHSSIVAILPLLPMRLQNTIIPAFQFHVVLSIEQTVLHPQLRICLWLMYCYPPCTDAFPFSRSAHNGKSEDPADLDPLSHFRAPARIIRGDFLYNRNRNHKYKTVGNGSVKREQYNTWRDWLAGFKTRTASFIMWHVFGSKTPQLNFFRRP